MDIVSSAFQEYYKRHISIPSFGLDMQHQVSMSSCLIVGLGGLGCPAALYLTVSGTGRVGLCDYDEIELSNLARQILFCSSDVGKDKTSVAMKVLREKNPYIYIEEHNMLLNESNAEEIIAPYDMVLDCTDNFHVKYLIHDTCLRLQKHLVQGALFQTHGQVTGFAFGDKSVGGCMRCLWSQEPPASCVSSCSQAGILSLVAGSVGLRQATTALQYMTQDYRHAGKTVLYRYSTQMWDELCLPSSHNCEYCGNARSNTRDNSVISREPLEIQRMPNNTWQVVDVRNEEDQTYAFGAYNVYHAHNEEIHDVSLLAQKLNKNTHYVLVCYEGIRSLDMSRNLRSLGIEKIHSYARGHKKFLNNEHISAD